MESWIWLAIVGTVAVVAGVIYWSYRLEQARREALHEEAGRLRLSFAPEGDPAFLTARLGAFGLFREGHSGKLTNLMRGTLDELEVAIFDYRYITGHGKNSHTHRQTLVLLGWRGTPAPPFWLRPEHVFHKIGSWFGAQDIDFDSRPEFSRAYLLRGPNEDAIRSLFSERLLAYFEAHPGLCLDCDGHQVMLYRHGHRVAPEDLREFLDLGRQTLEQIRPWRF